MKIPDYLIPAAIYSAIVSIPITLYVVFVIFWHYIVERIK